MLTLRPYQQAAIDAVYAAQARGVTRQIIALPCGLGKTVIFAHLIVQQQSHGRIIVVCHRDELLTQTREKILMVMPDARIGLVKAEGNDVDAPIVLASVQTLAHQRRREQLAREWALVVADESHHLQDGNTWEQSLNWLDGSGHTLVVGCTATPFRANGTPMVKEGSFFQEIIYSMHLLEAIEQGYLVMPRAIRLALKDFSLKGMRRVAGDYSASALEDGMMKVEAPKHLATALVEHATGRRTIAFSPGIDMAAALTESCVARGLRAATIIGDTPTEERRAAYQAMRSGELDVLSSVAVLSEGFDLPSVDTVLLARATTSRVLYQQTIGRALRLSPETEKSEALVLDATGATERNNLYSMAEMLGLIRKKETVETDDDRDEAVQSEDDEESSELEQTLMAYQSKLLRQSTFTWVVTQRGAFVLSLPDRIMLHIHANPATQRAVLQLQKYRRWKVLAQDIPLSHAFGIGEDTARSLGYKRFAEKTAEWLDRPASEKQRAFASKLGIDLASCPTAGTISDAITRIVGDWE